MVDLLAAHRHASEHRAEIEASRLCGCFNCLLTFKPDEIIAWTGWDNASLDDLANAQGHTALCPHCGSESVIGDASGYTIDPGFLTAMNQAWMQRTIIRPRPQKK